MKAFTVFCIAAGYIIVKLTSPLCYIWTFSFFAHNSTQFVIVISIVISYSSLTSFCYSAKNSTLYSPVVANTHLCTILNYIMFIIFAWHRFTDNWSLMCENNKLLMFKLRNSDWTHKNILLGWTQLISQTPTFDNFYGCRRKEDNTFESGAYLSLLHICTNQFTWYLSLAFALASIAK